MASAFDKEASKKPAGKGKVITMFALAGILGAVIFFHFNGVPQSASAADSQNAQPDIASLGNASDQIAALGANPTKNLLLHTTAPAASLGELHTNPFAISSKWYATLNPPRPQPRSGEVAPVKPVDTTLHLPPLDLNAVKATIKLQGIFTQSGKRVAFINGRILSVGAMVGQSQIFDILDDRVILQVPDYGDAGRFEALLNP